MIWPVLALAAGLAVLGWATPEPRPRAAALLLAAALAAYCALAAEAEPEGAFRPPLDRWGRPPAW